MISEKLKDAVKNNSTVREMFEAGKKLEEIYGSENVYNFSLGNPSIEPPKKINDTIIDIIKNEEPNFVHGYMNNAGFDSTREQVANSLNRKHQTKFTKDNIIMVTGAASGLNIIFKSILNKDDEVITFAPYFMEYNYYITGYDGKVVTVSPNTKNFQPNLDEFKEKITDKTKAVLINTPNNPTGVVYSEDTIKEISKILEEKEKEYNHEIYLISDEPYRELVYDNIKVPFITKYYNNTLIVYSFSKSLSLPGERIGYIVIPNEVVNYKELINALTISNRIIGCVNAPSLMQLVIEKCIDETVDIKIYNDNRNFLYKELTNLGFTCVKPEGAFYLFMKTPIEDDIKFVNKAKEYNLLLVPGTSFKCSGYVRISYCVDKNMLKRSLQAFKKLADFYKIK